MQLWQGLRLGLDPQAPDVVSIVGGGGKSSTAFRLAAEVAALGRRAIVAPTTRIAAFQTAWAPAFLEITGDELPWEALASSLERHGCCLLCGPVVRDRRLGLAPEQVDQLVERAAALQLAAITVEADGSKMRPVKAPASHEPVLPASTTHLVPVVGMDAVGAALDEQSVHRPERVRQVLGLAEGATAPLTPAQLALLLRHPEGGAKGLRGSLRPVLNKADSRVRLACARLVASLLAKEGVPALVARVGVAEQPPVLERWGQTAVVVLAAGSSSRMGRPKQLLPVQGVPMVVRAVRTALHSGVGPVLVVIGAAGEQVRAALGDLLPHIRLVENADWAAGQSTSVAAACAQLPDRAEAAIFMPVDQPYLDPMLLQQLQAAWRNGADLVAPVAAGLLRGAPALFDRRYWRELLALQGDTGGRRLLAAHPDAVQTVPAQAEWLVDIDTASDLAALAG